MLMMIYGGDGDVLVFCHDGVVVRVGDVIMITVIALCGLVMMIVMVVWVGDGDYLLAFGDVSVVLRLDTLVVITVVVMSFGDGSGIVCLGDVGDVFGGW